MMTDTAIRQDIRPGRREDAVACADMVNGWIDDRYWMPRVHTPDEVRDFYRDVVFERRTVWVTGDPIRGFLAMDEDAELVTALYVATPGQGIGRRLLNVAKARRDRLELWTFVANRGARDFYRREGFREIRQTDGSNEEGLPDVLLRWERAGQ
ncbi:N-acetyltransferase family protein [Rhodophyticola sp.]|jgi:GNAT superfamily N-acetyltransferase|uniref:GNAT family N-acetyltransferase n=1 Tax=Rhodophyticola sp. TaxID=2680032 RepID=UPI003D2B291E